MLRIITAIYILTTSSALVILKLGTKTGAPIQFIGDKIHLNLNIYTFAGISLYGISFLLYMYLISKYELGYIIPLTTAFVYIVIFAASFFIFKETFTVIKILGIAFIVLGLTLLNSKK